MITLPDEISIKKISYREYNVKQINSIDYKHSALRKKSKQITFALQYSGTEYTLQKRSGFSEQEANRIYDRYNNLYKVSIEWTNTKLKQAATDGYVTLAFGLRLRTPVLAQTIQNTSRTPHEASAEARTAGNALSQSYGMLTTRASIEFMQKVRGSSMALNIKPCLSIHDALYFTIKDDADVLYFLNKHLSHAVNWNFDPYIYHAQLNLGGNTEIFYPTWAEEHTISNNLTKEEICKQLQSIKSNLSTNN